MIMIPPDESFNYGSVQWEKFLIGGGAIEGAIVGMGFDFLEAVSYMARYGVDVFFLRWGGMALHMAATYLFFHALDTRQKGFILFAIGIHMAFNLSMIIISL